MNAHGFQTKAGLAILILLSVGCGGGSGGGGGGSVVTGESQFTPPNSPSDLVVTSVSNSQIDLQWKDNSNLEIGFIIERSKSGGSFKPIQALNSNTTFFQDSGLAKKTTYSYRVLAFNSNGNSGYSNTDHALTQTYTWAKSYGGAEDDLPSSIAKTSDGGFVICGATKSFGLGVENIWVVRVGAKGDILWQKVYGGFMDENASSVIQTLDLGFIVVGSTNSFGEGAEDFWALKLSPQGDVEWQRAYGDTLSNQLEAVFQTQDGGFCIAGTSTSPGVSGKSTVNLLKLKTDGGIEWQKSYSTAANITLRSVSPTQDNGYILACDYYEVNSGAIGPNLFVFKTDESGVEQWNKLYGLGYSHSIVNGKYGGYMIAGATVTPTAGNDFWAQKITETGDFEWRADYKNPTPSYPETNVPYSIVQANAGYFYLCGKTQKQTAQFNCALLKIGADGSLVWGKQYDGGFSQIAFTMKDMPGDGVIIGAAKKSVANDDDFWFVRADDEGGVAFNATSGAQADDLVWVANVSSSFTPAILILTVTNSNLKDTITFAVHGDTQCSIEEQAP